MLLARNMAAAQKRILCLNEEIERVVSHEGNTMLSSHLLHGAIQVGLSSKVMHTNMSYDVNLLTKR